MAKRSRGAQPGNTNALKHGFYTDLYTDLELTDLETALGKGLGDEIALMRVNIRRFVAAFDTKSNSDDPMSFEDASIFLTTLGSSMTRLSGLLRADKFLTGSDDSAVMQAIHAAITEFTEELKIL
jgi:hypothetical protein